MLSAAATPPQHRCERRRTQCQRERGPGKRRRGRRPAQRRQRRRHSGQRPSRRRESARGCRVTATDCETKGNSPLPITPGGDVQLEIGARAALPRATRRQRPHCPSQTKLESDPPPQRMIPKRRPRVELTIKEKKRPRRDQLTAGPAQTVDICELLPPCTPPVREATSACAFAGGIRAARPLRAARQPVNRVATGPRPTGSGTGNDPSMTEEPSAPVAASKRHRLPPAHPVPRPCHARPRR